jgi:multicomponent Na+:H+ antiporter subunit D
MIPAAFLIIVIPIVAAMPAIVLRRWRSAELGSALLGCILVVLLLARTSTEPARVLGWQISVEAPLNVLGRVIQVRGSERFPLLVLFLCAMLLFAGAWSTSQNWTFVPVGLGMLSLLSAGLMIRPFVYAALAFVAAAAVGTLMIQAERAGPRSTLGAARYLIIAVLALPLFLGAGYLVNEAETITESAARAEAFAPALTLLVIAFSLLLGAFPLFTWVHALAKDAPPLATAFIATISNGAALFLMLEFQQEFSWFVQSAQVQAAVRLGAIALLWVAGLLAWAQQSFARVVACAIFVELGSALLAINSQTALGVESIALGLIARAVALGLLGMGLAALLRHAQNTSFETLRGLGLRFRWPAIAIAIGSFTLVGLPGTLGFVQRWASARAIGLVDSESMLLMLFAVLSVGVGFARGLLALMERNHTPRLVPVNVPINWGEELGVGLFAVGVFLLGIVPSLIMPLAQAVADGYSFYK